MKTTKKALLFTFCAVLLVVASVLGTMAYLTSSETVTNTFTVGNVKITLDEAKVNLDGTYVTNKDDRTEDGNKYHLLYKTNVGDDTARKFTPAEAWAKAGKLGNQTTTPEA